MEEVQHLRADAMIVEQSSQQLYKNMPQKCIYKDTCSLSLDCSLLSRFAKRVLHRTQKPI